MGIESKWGSRIASILLVVWAILGFTCGSLSTPLGIFIVGLPVWLGVGWLAFIVLIVPWLD